MMFIHRGDSFGSTGNLSRRSRVPDLILGDDDVGYTPLPCIQVTQVLDRAERDPVVETVRRASEGLLGESQASAGGPQKATLKARPSGRTSRRVSLIPGEALEQAHAALEREQQQNQSNSSLLSSPAASRKNSTSGFSASFEQALRSSLQQQQIELQQQQQQQQQHQQQIFSSKSYEYDSYDGDRRDSVNRGDFIRNGDTLDCSIISPNRMKSNQRWLKLRTTVQLSGALSTSMNRAKPTLKREDSFIKRFSTRQIAELQDTVDHTDEEEINKTSSGSPKVRRKRRPRRPRSVINPYGNVYFYWLCILTICVLYNFWTGIVRQAFPELQRGYQTLWFVLDGFTDLTYALDIVVQFRTGYLEQGLIVYDHKKLADHYMHSKCFLFDIFTILPLDILQIPLGMNPMLRFPRFIKVYRVYNYYYMVESRTLYPNFWRVLNLVHILLLLAHWFGCFYYMLSEAENFKGEWTYPYTYGREFRTLTRKYLGSVYWSTLTLTTIGDLPTPESDKQYIFTIISYLIGVFIFATIVGQVGNVITNRNANRLEFERLLDGAKLYMRHHKVPREMQRRVQRWYDYSWSRGRIQGGGDINSALGLLPDKLRTELALHVNLSTLKKVSIFKECQPEFLHDLVLKMKAYIFTPGDLICRKGEVAREMFIIADGILEVISELGKVLTTMKAGDFFGEIGILNLDGLNKRTADVRSVGYSELFSLSREDVLAAMKDYPEAQEILQSLGHKRLKEARHQNCRPEIITPSSKIISSPSKGDGKDEKQPKKLVSRIRSDVSAIRNAFRKSRAMTKENETVELEPLNDDGKEFHENENETPSVKKILRRLGRTVGSGGSDGSFKISRGILKRMSHVTSDELNSQNQNKTIVEDQGVLGAGLPLLQRLKLLKEKEEREEREKRIPDSDSKSKRSLSQKRLKEFSMSLSHESTKDEISKSEEEPEVIGAGLPLFARLRLLKVKEEKEKMQTQTQGSKIKGSSIDSVHSSDRSSECSVLLPKKIEKSLSVDSRSSSSDSKPKDSTEKSTSVFKSKLKSVINQTKDPPSICVVSPSRKEDSKEEDAKINDLNKGTNMSGMLSPHSSSNGQIESNTIENQQSSRDSSSSDPSFSKPINIKLNVQETNQMSNSNVGETHSPISPTSLSVDDTSRDKIQRSESFRKAMDSDLIEESEEGELNIQDLSSKDENSVESERTKEMEEEYKDEPDNKEQRSNKDNSTELTKSSSSDSEINILRNGREKTNFPKAKIDSSPEDNNSKAANSSLRVPSNEISPPLSSPESTETPERKNLKSILKRISRDDSTCNLLPQGSADLRRLMKAQTVQGFMARRSKLSKAVSFQRKTLSSPPSSTIFDILNSNSKSKFRARSFDVSNGSRINSNSLPSLIYHQDQVLSPDGVQKVLSKLTSFGVESPCHSEDLVRGVESILRDKIEDVEVAWEARIAALKQEVAIRDETIKILSETIKCLQDSSDEIILNRINLEDKTLNDIEIINSKTRDDMDSKRVRTPCLLVQISESSNPSSDEDEPLFMRCNSIESIIHQTPDVSPEGERSIDPKIQESAKKPQFQRQMTVCQKQRNSLDSEEEAQPKRRDVVIDFGESSTDDDIYSFSSDDDHVIFSSKSEGFSISNELDNENSDSVSEMLPDDLDEEPEDLDDLNSVEKGEITDNQLNSQDWEVQMLARQLAKEQRGVARRIDRDIATGKLQSPLAELHEALATDNLTNLTELDLIRLEKIVRKEREKLRQYARMYSLDERPVLEDEFSSLYRSRSQMLLSKSSALCRAGPTERRLSTLLKQLTTLPPSEQFLLDRLVYKSARKRGFSRQQSLCDEHLSSYGESRAFKFGSRANISMKRSMSMCSPPPEYNTITGQSLIMMDEDSPPLMTKEIAETIGEDGFNNERIESSSTTEVVSEIREPFRHSGDATTLNNTSDQNKISLQRETQPLLRPSR